MILTYKRPLFWFFTIIFAINFYNALNHFDSFTTIEEASTQTYDYVIVGAGSTGSVLANRLSARANASILLIEAGGHFGLLSKIPLLTTFQQKASHDWQYETTAQLFSSRGFVGQKQNMPRGKGLGGSSQLNYMLHFDGLQRDFDEWRQYGLDLGLLAEDTADTNVDEGSVGQCATQEDACSDGSKFALPVTTIPYDYSGLSMAFADSISSLKSTDGNLHFLAAQYNTKRGYRFSVYDSYLKPLFGRQNLDILINTRVQKILFKEGSAQGVLVSPDDQTNAITEIRVRNEVILCAGAINTPEILMQSGIGPKQHLQQHQIPVVFDAPHVGRNLYDHLSVPLFVVLDDAVSITRDKLLSPSEIFNYLLHGEGFYANFGVLGYVFSPVDQHSVGIFGVGAVDEDVLRDIANYDQETFRATFPYYANGSQEGLVLLNACNQPLSRGSITLSSRRPNDRVYVNPSYLEDNQDVSCTIRAIRLAVDMIETEPFRRLGARIVWPRFKKCQNFGPFEEDFQTNRPLNSYLECLVRTSGTTAHHPGGTCAIGQQPTSPVDSKFRLRGVAGVRVMDASVLPIPVSGTPHSVLIRMAERASNVILQDKINK